MKTALLLLLAASATVSQPLNVSELFQNATEIFESSESCGDGGAWFYELKQNYTLVLVVLVFIGVAYLLIRQDVVLLRKVQEMEKELGSLDSELLSCDSKEFSMAYCRQV